MHKVDLCAKGPGFVLPPQPSALHTPPERFRSPHLLFRHLRLLHPSALLIYPTGNLACRPRLGLRGCKGIFLSEHLAMGFPSATLKLSL
ncbi:hypothetical protein MY4824_004322 [Beauveria thailandica]